MEGGGGGQTGVTCDVQFSGFTRSWTRNAMFLLFCLRQMRHRHLLSTCSFCFLACNPPAPFFLLPHSRVLLPPPCSLPCPLPIHHHRVDQHLAHCQLSVHLLKRTLLPITNASPPSRPQVPMPCPPSPAPFPPLSISKLSSWSCGLPFLCTTCLSPSPPVGVVWSNLPPSVAPQNSIVTDNQCSSGTCYFPLLHPQTRHVTLSEG
jgi:hypothetical protein